MRNVTWVALTGLAMLVAGGLMMFASYDSLPLWLIWFVGPLFWYLGFGIAIGGFAAHFFIAPKRAEEAESTPVLKLARVGRRNAPQGIVREVPAMGGFLL